MYRVKFVLALSSLSTVAACATLPEMPEDALTTAEVIENIKCEVRSAVREVVPTAPWLKSWNGAFILELGINRQGSVALDAGLDHPLVPAVFSLPLTGSIASERTRSEKIYFSLSFAKIANEVMTCPDDAAGAVHRTPLTGRIGIADILERARTATEQARIDITQLDYSISFNITLEGDAHPKFTMVPIAGVNTIDAGLKVSGSSKRSHDLTVTLRKTPDVCPDFEKFYRENKVCPSTVVATVPLDQARDKRSSFTEDTPGPGAPRTQQRTWSGGVSPDAQRDLERAQDRNVLQNLRKLER